MAGSTRPGNSSSSSSRIKPETGRTNSLNMTRIELDSVLDALDNDPTASANAKRQSSRMAFRETGVQVEIVQPGGQTRFSVACRNLSRDGLGFLHSSYLHVNTPVMVTLPHRSLGSVRIEGTLVRCRHVKRHIHDIGVRFKNPLNLRDFMEIDTLAQSFSCERVDATQVKGVLLIVAEYKIEQGYIQSMLRETSMDFVTAATIADGVTTACKGCDIIICDDSFETGTGAEFIARARENGVRCPIVIMSADRSAEGRQRLRAANASGFIEKPIVPELLLRAMAEFLVVPGENAADMNPLTSTLPFNSPLAALADDFVTDLRACADDVERLAKSNDLVTLRKRVLRVAGAAPALGFEPIAKMGHALLATINASKGLAECTVAINTFVATCRAVRKRPSSATPPVAPATSAPPSTKAA